MEGVSVGPKERERRLAKHLVDRSHRGRNGRRRRHRPMWTRAEKALLVLCLALIFAEVAVAAEMLLWA